MQAAKIHACIHIHVTRTCMQAHTPTNMYTNSACMHACMQGAMHVCMHICVQLQCMKLNISCSGLTIWNNSVCSLQSSC